MAKHPPLWNQALSYPAQLDRYLLGSLWPHGGVLGAALSVVANTMTANVAPGSAAVPLQAGQGAALCHWDAPEPVTFSPATATDRVDAVVVVVRDNAVDGGPNNDFQLLTVPTAAIPPNSLKLYEVIVSANSVAVQQGQVYDYRGAGLARPAYDLQAGIASVTTDTASNCHLDLPRSFMGVPQVAMAVAYGWSGTPGAHFMLNSGSTPNHVVWQVRDFSGNVMAVGNGFLIQWLAIYTPDPTATTSLDDLLKATDREEDQDD